MKDIIKQIIESNLPEKKRPLVLLVNRYQDVNEEFNECLSQIDTSLIADEVLKVAVDRIKEYKNKECKESVIDGIKYGLINGEKICDDIISNLSPNKENKNNE